MTARTVPPSGQPLFGVRDLALAARRNLTRGLAVSALAHFALLAAIVVSQEREPALRLVRGAVDIVPTAPVFTPPIADPVTPRPVTAPPPDAGDWGLVEDFRIQDLPSKPVVGGHVRNGEEDGPRASGPAGEAGPATLDRMVEPAPGVFVYFDEPPVPLTKPAPRYPEWARENGITGTVLLRVLVDRDGAVRRVTVLRGVEGLTEAARDALMRWTFRPASAMGRPVAVWVDIPVEFRLGG